VRIPETSGINEVVADGINEVVADGINAPVATGQTERMEKGG
jgi:hypothetical protein